GAIYNRSTVVITNCTIADNSTDYGGGVYNTEGTTTLNNTIVSGNTAEGGPDLFVDTGELLGAYNLIGDGSDQTSLTDGTDGNQVGLAGSPLDPWFIDPAAGNYQLQVGALAVDQGSNTIAVDANDDPLTVDLLGETRIQNEIVNIGAYETYYADNRVGPVLYVDLDATGGSSSWENAYTNLQAALNQAYMLNNDAYPLNDVSQIWIAEGTYYPTAELEPGEARSASFSLLDSVSLYGGFVGTETTLGERTLSTEHATILSGDLGTIDDMADNAYSVVYANDVTGTTIDGLTITKGYAVAAGEDSPFWNNGAGLWIYESEVSVLNSTFTQNEAQASGGGIYAELGNVTITGCTFYQNTAGERGGGVYSFYNSTQVDDSAFEENFAQSGGGIFENGNNSSSTSIANSTFTKNFGTSGGGGIFSWDGQEITITGSTFDHNFAVYYGGGLFVGKSNTIDSCTFINNVASYGAGLKTSAGIATYTNSLFANNTAFNFDSTDLEGVFDRTPPVIDTYPTDLNYGGAIYNRSALTIANCTIADNSAVDNGGGVYNPEHTATLNNTIVSGNTAANGPDLFVDTGQFLGAYNLISDGSDQSDLVDGVDGNTVGAAGAPIDPVFVNPATGDYRPQIGSPAIDQGDDSLAVDANDAPLLLDLAGVTRIQGDAVDIGAYETGYTDTLLGPILYVDVDTVGNWENAYTDLQAALDQAAWLNGDAIPENDVEQIWVAEGTYYPTSELDPVDARFASFRLADGVEVHGGFLGTETELSERVLSDEHATILSGDLGVLDDVSDNAYTVVYCGTGVTTTLDGLTITGGYSPGVFSGDSEYSLLSEVGAGVYSGGDLTIINSTVRDNKATGGGGIYNDTGTLTIGDSTIKGNKATSTGDIEQGLPNGGGIHNATGGTLNMLRTTVTENYSYLNGAGVFSVGTANIAESRIHNNETMVAGGGVVNSSGQMFIVNSTVSQNLATYCGGILHEGGTIHLLNSTIADNIAYNAGGMLCASGTINITNSTITHNVANSQGGGIFYGVGDLTLNNSIIALNEAPSEPDFLQHAQIGAVSASNNLLGNGDSQTILVDGVDGNQVGTYESPIDPMFTDWTVDEDGMGAYYLMDGSPAHNAGNNALAVTIGGSPLTTDQVGNTRIQGGLVDIGAIESSIASTPGVTYVVTSFNSTIAHDGELTFLEAYLAATQNRSYGDAPAGSWDQHDTIQFDRALESFVLRDEPLQLFGSLILEGFGDDQTIFAGSSSRLIDIQNTDAKIVLRGLTLTGGYNLTDIDSGYTILGAGGAISNRGTLLLDDMMILNNTAETGGGIFNLGELAIANSEIHGNHAMGYDPDNNDVNGRGGGIHNVGRLNVSNSLFVENSVDGLGGGIMNQGQMILNNVTMTNNYTFSQEGAGIYTESSAAELYNSIVANNRIWDTSVHSDIYNDVVGTYNLIGDGTGQSLLVDGADGNMVGTSETPILPEFADPDGGNFRLGSGSPAIDQGSNELAVDPSGTTLQTDLGGHPRIQNETVDLGAYEYGMYDWGTVRLNVRDRTDSEDLWWTDEWSGCWVEIWATGNASSGIGGFDIAIAYEAGCFVPDMTQIVPGPEVDGQSLITFNETPGVLQLAGPMLDSSAGQGSEVLIAKVYFKPAPGDSTLPRDTDGKYLTPVFDAGFYVSEAMMAEGEGVANNFATIEVENPVNLWPVMYDMDGDAVIGLSDVLTCLGAYQMAVDETALPEAWASDFDRSGRVDLADVLDLLGKYQWQKGSGISVTYPDEFPPVVLPLLIEPELTTLQVLPVYLDSTFPTEFLDIGGTTTSTGGSSYPGTGGCTVWLCWDSTTGYEALTEDTSFTNPMSDDR
ncbi:MAG: right-handed parallel beta-helix repeat-containing protein, partial [Planctomycetia bacterium]